MNKLQYFFRKIFLKRAIPFFVLSLWTIQFSTGAGIFPGVLPSNKFNRSVENFVGLYQQLNLDELGLSLPAYEFALKGFTRLCEQGRIHQQSIISIVDFSKPSTEKRLFILDLQNRKLLFNTLVAHGKNSGELFARYFSNEVSSLKSSMGFFETGATYIGKNGLSLILNGLEYGINNNAQQRAIVLHGAPYVSEETIRMQGRIGRSFGCPAVPLSVTPKIIESIKNGTCLFIYSPDQKYLSKSPVLNS